jgi:Ca2+-binding EF-hand superfamily protein
MESWSQLDFDKLDLDGDGVVSKEELATALARPACLISACSGSDQDTLVKFSIMITLESLDEKKSVGQDWDSMGEVKDEVGARIGEV